MTAGLYTKLSKPHLRPAWELLQRLRIQPGERVLAFPCSSGELCGWIAGLTGDEGSLAAADHHPTRYQEASRALQEAGLREARAFLVDPREGETLGVFDAAFSHHVCPWPSDPGAFLAWLRGHLRPGGRFALQMPASGFCQELAEAVARIAEEYRPAPRLPPGPTAASLRVTAEGLGLRELDLYEKSYVERFPLQTAATDHLLEALLGTPLPGGPEVNSAWKEVLHDVVAEGARRTGEVELVFRRLFAFGRR